MLFQLLRTKRFLPLLLTQFFGAFNDNLFKNALMILIAFRLTEQAEILSQVVAGLFILPFVLFSGVAGQIADKYNRSNIAQVLKFTELGLMILTGITFMFHSVYLLIILLFLMGTQSAFFGPIKYALLPQLLKKEELIAGNGAVEGSTYLSILLGSVLGTLLPIPAVVGVLLLCAVIGLVSSRFIPSAPAPRAETKISKNLFAEIFGAMKVAYQYPIAWQCILGATWFWMLGVFILTQIFPLCSQTLQTTQSVVSFFLVLFSVGVAVGSASCHKLLGGIVHVTFVPLSALMLVGTLILLWGLTAGVDSSAEPINLVQFIMSLRGILISLDLFVFAFFGGLYIVPLNAMMQVKAPKKYLATVIAANNIVNSIGMVLVAGFSLALISIGLTIPQLFLAMGILSLGVVWYLSHMLPDTLIRSILQTILICLFRVRVKNLECFEKAGNRVVIIANHTSLLDGLLMAAFMPERITFAINTEWAKKWWVRPFHSLVNLYALDPLNPMALRSLIALVKDGEKVMIFPEGRITVTGSLMKIYDGAAVIADKAGATLLPVRIKGADTSYFSYQKGLLVQHAFPRITLDIQMPVQLDVDKSLVGKARRQVLARQLYDVMTKMMYTTADIHQNVFNDLLHAANRYGWYRVAAEDTARKPQTFKQFILKSYVLAQAYQKYIDTDKVGLFLPNALATVISFYALQKARKIPAMLNFSLGLTQLESCIKTVGLKVVVTSHQFVEKGHFESHMNLMNQMGVRVIYLEDFARKIGCGIKLRGYINYLQRKLSVVPANETAVILFTSGSEGMPKAIFLSHENLQANRYQLAAVLPFNTQDICFNALPIFHSFGLTVGMIVTLLSGIKTIYYPSPLHYRIIPELFYDTNATVICGTDSFMFGYGRVAHPYDFHALRYAIVGGERLKEVTAELWMHKFGVRILQGYGATETSPVIALNTPMYYQENCVGRVLPGIQYKLNKVKGVAEGGELVITGDNVMQGIMRPDNPLKLQKIHDKTYATGDIVQIDESGFVHICGRLKRFAKVAGEMVSLTAVEQILDKLYPNETQGVVTVPHDRKGEELVFITSHQGVNLPEVREFMRSCGVSELWIPKQIKYMKNPPKLGTGKFDYQAASKLLNG